jgi:hypothetical protein
MQKIGGGIIYSAGVGKLVRPSKTQSKKQLEIAFRNHLFSSWATTAIKNAPTSCPNTVQSVF